MERGYLYARAQIRRCERLDLSEAGHADRPWRGAYSRLGAAMNVWLASALAGMITWTLLASVTVPLAQGSRHCRMGRETLNSPGPAATPPGLKQAGHPYAPAC